MWGWINLIVTVAITCIAISVAIFLDIKIKQTAELYRLHRYLTRLMDVSLAIEHKYSNTYVSLMKHALLKSTEPIMFYWFKKSKIPTFLEWKNKNKETFESWRNAEAKITRDYEPKKYVESMNKIINILTTEIVRYKTTTKKIRKWYKLPRIQTTTK